MAQRPAARQPDARLWLLWLYLPIYIYLRRRYLEQEAAGDSTVRPFIRRSDYEQEYDVNGPRCTLLSAACWDSLGTRDKAFAPSISLADGLSLRAFTLTNAFCCRFLSRRTSWTSPQPPLRWGHASRFR